MKRIAIALAFVLLLLALLHSHQAKRFNEGMRNGFHEQPGIFPYYIQVGEGNYTLHLGDMNGMNPESYLSLTNISAEGSLIVVPSVMPDHSKAALSGLIAEDFYYQVANKNGVVIAHNFCSPDWESNKDIEIYRNSALSIGAFCQSEEESARLDRIIREYNVRRVILYYDVDSYKAFMQPFLGYLDVRGIDYEFKSAQELD